jgi:hypothetical protein
VILQESYQLDLKREHAMTDHNFIDPEKFLSDQLAAASPDLLRSMLGTFITALMGAEADAPVRRRLWRTQRRPRQFPQWLQASRFRHSCRNTGRLHSEAAARIVFS